MPSSSALDGDDCSISKLTNFHLVKYDNNLRMTYLALLVDCARRSWDLNFQNLTAMDTGRRIPVFGVVNNAVGICSARGYAPIVTVHDRKAKLSDR